MGERSFMMNSMLKIARMIVPFNNMERLDKYLKKVEKKSDYAYKIPNGMRLNGSINKVINADMPVYILNPRHFRSKKKVIYFHGGGYVLDMAKQHWQMLDKIGKLSGASILIPIYPLAPANNFEVCFERIISFYDELTKCMDSKDLIFMGDSAGAGLALGFAEYLRELGKDMPSQIIMISPWLDLSMENTDMKSVQLKDNMLGIDELKKCGRLWAGDVSSRDYRVSPMFGNLDGLPKMSVFTGTDDILNCDAREFKRVCEKKGIDINYFEYENMPHVFPLFPSKDSKEVLKKIGTELLYK